MISGGVFAVGLAEAPGAERDDEVALRTDRGARGEGKQLAVVERPAAKVGGLVRGVVELDPLQVVHVVRRVVEDFVDHHARGHRARGERDERHRERQEHQQEIRQRTH